MAKRKGILNSALKALLAGVETSAAVKIPATFIAELASLPDEKQKVLAELSQEQFNALLTQSQLAAINAASSAADAKQIKSLIKELMEKVDRALADDSSRPNVLPNQNLPYPSLGRFFKGRDHILATLRKQLAHGGKTAITQSQTIHGLGGVGKTRLAVEFAWWVWENQKCHAVFFVAAESPPKLNASLAALADPKLLDLTGKTEAEQIRSVKQWLARHPGWLIIIDNADTEKAATAVEALLPDLAAGRVIITSRYTRWSAAVQPISLELLNLPDARQLLLDRTFGRRIQTENDTAVAEELAVKLDRLPLALEQAAAYIAHDKSTLAEYLHEWDNDAKDVLTWCSPREMNYPDSVAVTWMRTFKQLSLTSRTILNLAAFLAPEPIPTDMFTQGQTTVAQAARLMAKSTGRKSKTKLKIDCKEAVNEIAAFSMIDKQPETFTIHRIVQQVIRSHIPAENIPDWIELALNLVNDYAPSDSDDVRTWPILNVLRPHAETIARTADEADIKDPTSRLMSVLDSYLSAKGLYPQAEYFSRRALVIDENSFGPDHPEVATDLNNLAELLRATNRLDEAETMYRRALEIRKKSLGDKHPDYATSLNDLAELLRNTNRLSEAEPLYHQVLEIYEDSFGKDHPWVSTTLNNLSLLLQDTNRLDDAEPLMRRALEIDENSFGPDHPDVATDLNNLAELLRATNRLKEAEPMYRRALKIDENSFEPDHPEVAIDLNNLALLLKATNRQKDAVPLYRRAWKIMEKSLGPDHPNTQTIRKNLETLLNDLP
jgi:tetratricopeptide (TPR) repeat protein